MKVLIACEESQRICIEFRNKGHDAYSCDILQCSGSHPEWHIQDDVLKHLVDGWELMIAHPPCTYISYAGTRHWNIPGRCKKRLEALEFFRQLWEAPIPKICIENPKGCASPTIAKYTQEIQPYYFGDRDFKTTWLWLKGLPKLVHIPLTPMFEEDTTHTEKPIPVSIEKSGKKRYFTDGTMRDGGLRSKTFPSIARAMAEQWG